MKRTLIFCVFVNIAFMNIQAQGTLKDAQAQIDARGTYETLIYYGVDFSHVLINDASKISKSVEYSQVYPSAWISFVEKELPPEGYVKDKLKFPTFSYNQQEIYNQSIAVNPQFITDHDNNIPPEELQKIISKLDLQSKSGLALVLIPETFSKPQETGTTWVVFFDIGSREIIYQTKAYGECSHMGYTAHWGSGVVEGFKHFVHH